MNNRKLLTLIFLVSAIPIVHSAEAQDAARATHVSGTIDQALASFLQAFDNLDWPSFRACFDAHPTIFHPAAPNVERIDSPSQFDKAWLDVFERIRKNSGRTTPPYMDLKPQDLQIQQLSQDVALVTFHLKGGNTVGRRTLVFKRYPEDGWKIVHLHASTLAITTEPRSQ